MKLRLEGVMVYYRKYRPQTIDQLDSTALRQIITSVLSSSSIPHAFLFTGPKGLGKTSTARILAKAVNCQRAISHQQLATSARKAKLKASSYRLEANVEPCNKCDQCLSITDGSNLDVIEIDAASNRGIDEIRDLREKLRLTPVSAKKKIYIIDEVHMLTTEAFNALLKSLEEPPEHVMFILCTTEAHKVPATILSRCFHIAFKKATIEELVRSFERITKGEKLSIDKEALSYIASLSDGGFRDGVKILEEMAFVAKEEKITKVLIEQKFQSADIQLHIQSLLTCFAEKKTKEALAVIATLVEQGTDMKYVIEQLINTLHGILIQSITTAQETQFTTQELKALVMLLSRAYGELKYAVLPQLPLELVIIDWAHGKSEIPPPLQSGNTKELLYKLIDIVKQSNQSIGGLLRGSSIKQSDENTFIIEAPYQFHMEKLIEPKALALLEKAVEEMSGKKKAVSVVLRG